MRSEEHTSELQSHSEISYAVFCLKKKKKKTNDDTGHSGLDAHQLANQHESLASAGLEADPIYCFQIGSLFFFFFFNDTATTEIYTLSYTLSLHDALPI